MAYRVSKKTIIVIGNLNLNKINMCHTNQYNSLIEVSCIFLKEKAEEIIKNNYVNINFTFKDRLRFIKASIFKKVILWVFGRSAKSDNNLISSDEIDDDIISYIRGEFSDIISYHYRDQYNYHFDNYGNFCKGYNETKKSYFESAEQRNNDSIIDRWSRTWKSPEYVFSKKEVKKIVSNTKKDVININNFSEGEINLFIKLLDNNPKKFEKILNKYKGKEKEIREFILCERNKKNGVVKEEKETITYKNIYKKTNFVTVGDLSKINFKLIEGVILSCGTYISLETMFSNELNGSSWFDLKTQEGIKRVLDKFKNRIKEDILYSKSNTILRVFDVYE